MERSSNHDVIIVRREAKVRVHTSGVGVLWEKEVWVCGNALLPIQNYRYVVSTHDTQYYILPSGWVRIAGPVMSPPHLHPTWEWPALLSLSG